MNLFTAGLKGDERGVGSIGRERQNRTRDSGIHWLSSMGSPRLAPDQPRAGWRCFPSFRPWQERVGSVAVQRNLKRMHRTYILIHMRTTLNIEDELLNRASQLTGIKEKTALVRRGLEALIALESARRLAALGGTEKKLEPVRRRRQSA